MIEISIYLKFALPGTTQGSTDHLSSLRGWGGVGLAMNSVSVTMSLWFGLSTEKKEATLFIMLSYCTNGILS